MKRIDSISIQSISDTQSLTDFSNSHSRDRERQRQLFSSTTTSTPAQFPAVIQLSNLNGQNGFKIDGENLSGSSGHSVSATGDINGDGYTDLLIGASSYDGGSAQGRSYVVFGGPEVGNAGILLLSSLNGTSGFKLDGDSNSGSGWSVSWAGDVNRDGYADLVIGTHGAGRSYVVFGGHGVGNGGILLLPSLNGTNGFRVYGQGTSGWSVSTAGDINGDGYADVVIGDYDSLDCSYVVFGRSGIVSGGILSLSMLNGTNGFKLNGGQSNDFCGWSVGGVGDINGDGYGDIVIGAPGNFLYSTTGITGTSYVVFGGSKIAGGGVLSLSSLNGTNGFKLMGENDGDYSGYSVSAGDINGDGRSDLIIGAYGYPGGNNMGRSYVVFGGPGVGSSGVLSLSSLTGINGFKLNGENNGDYSGYSVSSAGDINGDGYEDLLIGAWAYPKNFRVGCTYVVFGGPGVGSGGAIDLSSLNGINGFKLDGEDNGDFSGESVSAAGDINGDGRDDLIIGAPSYQAGYERGRSYVVFGDSAISPPSVNYLVINQSQVLTLTSRNLNVSDANHTAVSLSFVITNLQHGKFSLVTASTQAITQFSYVQLSTNQVQFSQDGSLIAPSYTVQVQGKTFAISPAQNASVTFYSLPVIPLTPSPSNPTSTPSSAPASTSDISSLIPLIAEIAGGAIGGGILLLSLCCLYRCLKKKPTTNSSVREVKTTELSSFTPSPVSPPVVQGLMFPEQPREYSVIPSKVSSISRPSQASLSASGLPAPLTLSLSQSGKGDSEVISELKVPRRSASPSSPRLIDDSGEMKISLNIAYKDLEFDEKDKLGSGAYGTVYRGTYKFNEVAIKQLHASHLSDGAVEELKQEAGILGSMRSNYIVQLLGICLQPPNYCMVMELMPKGSLYGILQNSPELPLSVRYRIGLDVCSGLFHLHEMNILHRDLKSLNVLLDDRFRAKITDFGLSKMKSEMGSVASSKGMKGTLGWMAPELFAEKPQATTAADIYALGMVLWEMMVQPYRIPFQDMVPASLITAKLTRGEKQETIPDSCPPKLAQLIRACWREADKRPPARVLAKSLSALFKSSQQETPKVSVSPSYDPLKSEVPGYGQNLMSKVSDPLKSAVPEYGQNLMSR